MVMGFLKDLGSFVGQVAGGVIGGAVELVGEATNSDFIKDVGKGVYQATSKTGELVGGLASGAYDAIGGLITDDKLQASQGLDELFDTVGNAASGIGKGIANIADKGIETVGAIIDGDTDRALEVGKEIAKVAAIGVLSIGLVDLIDGVDGIAEAADAPDVDGVDHADYTSVDNPNMHHVTPYLRHNADGTTTWVDGDGDPTTDNTVGWNQHNPDYRVPNK
jgi:phage-related protein